MSYLIMIIAAAVGGLAQLRVKSAYKKASQIPASSGINGQETAQAILDSEGIENVGIEMIEGTMSDHYDPRSKMLRLSSDVYSGTSLASLGIAAHEVGHAIQDASSYSPLVLRNGIVPFASKGSKFAFALFMAGAVTQSFWLFGAGVALFSLTVIFQLINLPVEFNASSRAKSILLEKGMINQEEHKTVDKVLDAAALTYVAATVTSIAYLVYYLWQMGLLGGRRD